MRLWEKWPVFVEPRSCGGHVDCPVSLNYTFLQYASVHAIPR